MSITLINKIFLIFSCLIVLSACSSTKSIYSNLKGPVYDAPVAKDLDDQKITLNSSNTNITNYEKKIILSELKNKSQYNRDIIIRGSKIFTLNENNKLYEFNYSTGELSSITSINYLNIEDEKVISFHYLKDTFLIALKSGPILNIDLNGKLMWKFDSNKILNSPLFIFDEQVISLHIDEINNISLKDGSLIWSENYNGLPIYQSKGGQLVNFLNLLFFILPNNKVGSIDLNFGTEHNFVFDKIPLIGSINNTEDYIHIFDNYFTYLDEGKYLYTVDILSNNFNLFKENIK